jgi:hypothetical protein
VNINFFLNIPGLSIASPFCMVVTFCLLGACAVLRVGGRLFGVTVGGGFPTLMSVGTAFQFRLFLKKDIY